MRDVKIRQNIKIMRDKFSYKLRFESLNVNDIDFFNCLRFLFNFFVINFMNLP